jgi:hypothetical protein
MEHITNAINDLTISTDEAFVRMVKYLRRNGEKYGRFVGETLFLDSTIFVNMKWYNSRCLESVCINDETQLWPALGRLRAVGITHYKYLFVPTTKEPAVCAVVISDVSFDSRRDPTRIIDCHVDLRMLNWFV